MVKLSYQMHGDSLIRRKSMDTLNRIKSIEKIKDNAIKQEEVRKFIEEYIINDSTEYLGDVIEFLTEIFRIDYFEEKKYFELYPDIISKLTNTFIEQIYTYDMSDRNIDILLFVAGVAYDFSYKYYEKLAIVRLVLCSPYITDRQKLYAVNMVLDGEPEITNEMTGEEIEKYRSIQKTLS